MYYSICFMRLLFYLKYSLNLLNSALPNYSCRYLSSYLVIYIQLPKFRILERISISGFGSV